VANLHFSRGEKFCQLQKWSEDAHFL
jgi:hypothetical protein